MGKISEFKEASFIEGRLVRISKRKIEIESVDEESGDPALLTVRLAEGVDIDLDTIGEDIKAVIVDGKVARISPLTQKLRDKSLQERNVSPGPSRELGAA